MGSVLIVGASGILAPAASALVARGEAVTGIGRRRAMPAGAAALHVDGHDLAAVDHALGITRWTTAIVYEPAVTAATLRRIAASIDDRLVLVRTSAAADPAHGAPNPEPGTLLLGWVDDDGSVRWHTPEEISDAALEVLADGAPRILGSVRPWERRP